jgi:hypothetical protein
MHWQELLEHSMVKSIAVPMIYRALTFGVNTNGGRDIEE